MSVYVYMVDAIYFFLVVTAPNPSLAMCMVVWLKDLLFFSLATFTLDSGISV